jgi:hypothetical protein
VENLSCSQALVNPQLSKELNMAFVKKGRILLAVIRAVETE